MHGLKWFLGGECGNSNSFHGEKCSENKKISLSKFPMVELLVMSGDRPIIAHGWGSFSSIYVDSK